jgi:Uma2 family endonuclease
MVDAVQAELLDHVGPWTEDEYLALPEDNRRIELLDGGLLVNPSPSGPHQRLSSHLWLALSKAAPAGLEVIAAINVRVAPERILILIPDLAIVTNPGVDLTVWPADEVAMVVEIMSPGSVATDRAVKPELYARAGIAHYLRVELGRRGPKGLLYRLEHGRPVQTARSEPGKQLRLAQPFPVALDLLQLAVATRPPTRPGDADG